MKDYYKILGVDQSAETEVITSAYKALVYKYQDDTYKDPDAEDRMKEINEAYEVLNNHLKRADYDRSRKGEGSSPPPSDNKDESDLKECPYCAEMIKAKAILCKHCGKSLTSSEPKQEPLKNKQTTASPSVKTNRLFPM
jgi:curved DNA-binding protein CbpA